MKSIAEKMSLRNIIRFIWAAFLLFLPVTSFPFFPPAFGGEALVRPLSLYPLLLLVILVIIPRLFSRPLPGALLALLPFVLVGIASSLLSLLRGIEPALGISVGARVMRGLSTLLIGCTIYLAIALLPDTMEDLRFSLRWIYTGCGVALFWGSLQALYVLHFNPAWFDFLHRLQEFISYRRLLPERISGLTYEPHWFAEQIIVLLLPGLLAAVLNGYTVFNKRWRWLTIEWLLLGWAVILLPFTYSRSGVINLVVLLAFSALVFRPRDRKPAINPAGISDKIPAPAPGLLTRTPLRLAAVIFLAILPVYIIGARNTFFSRLWEYWRQEDASMTDYLSYLGFDARVAYGLAAYNAYLANPMLGIGLGNYAFYFEEMLPNRPIAAIPEVLRMVTPEKGRDRLVTSKNFYLRLLSETGMIGSVAFLAFVVCIFGCALSLWLSPGQEWRFWGTVSLSGLTAFALSALTFDSFVIPNMWVVFGLVTAATRVNRQTPPSAQTA